MSDNSYLKDSTLSEIEQKVLKAISLYNRPVTVSEIATELGVSRPMVIHQLQSLLKKGNIVKYTSQDGIQQYYSPTVSKTGLDAVLSQKYADIAGSLEKQYADIKAENDNLRQQIDKLYANILTLMGIFVSIFSLIIINVDAIGSFMMNVDNSDVLFRTLIKLNVPLVTAIVVLILLIKFLFLTKLPFFTLIQKLIQNSRGGKLHE